MGGRDAVLAAAKAAFDKKEVAWAGQLVNYLYKLDTQDKEVRLFKAKVLRQLAYLSTGANSRSHLMTQALVLENKVIVPRLIMPQAAIIAKDPKITINYFRVRIDPEKSGETDKVIRFEFTDGGKPVVGLHIRRAVVEYLPSPDDYGYNADLILALSGPTWAKIFLNQAEVSDLISAGEIKVKKGSTTQATDLFGLFTQFRPENTLLVEPLRN